MKGTPDRQAAVYHTFDVEDLIEAGHPLRAIKRMVDRALAENPYLLIANHLIGWIDEASRVVHTVSTSNGLMLQGHVFYRCCNVLSFDSYSTEQDHRQTQCD